MSLLRSPRPFSSASRAAIAALCLLAGAPAGKAQTWTHLTNNPPAAVSLILLLSDGTVMAAGNNGSTIGKTWYKLTPNAAGSYINGTWTTLTSAADTRLYYSSQVLRDGRVFVAGGEYGTGTARAEIYDPVTNLWTQVNPPASLLDPTQNSPVTGSTQRFYDSNSELLADGSVLIAPVMPKVSGQPLIYNPATNTWSAGPNYLRGAYQDETAWVKLADNTILTMDPFGAQSYGAGNNPTERYNPATNSWINDGNVPVTVFDPFGFELGGAVLLPNGNSFWLGSTGQTAIYIPSGAPTAGSWIAGPVIPGSHGTPDAPCCVMVNGKVLCAVSPLPTSGNHFPTPTTFYEYDYVGNSFTSVNAPSGASESSPPYQACMLQLPDGNVLFSRMTTNVYVYTPSGSPIAAGKPVIQSVTPNGDGSFHLTGTGLNGISEGASYGDDLQMASNYPIVRINHSNGNKYFARTFNWSSTGVMTGSQVLTVEYRPPASLPAGAYTITAIGNGFASDPFDPNGCTGPLVGTNPAASQIVCLNGSVSLSVTATGTSPTYQWRRGVTALINGGNISGANTPTLTINPAGFGDTGSDYNCFVSNGCGNATSNFATITVDAGGYANCDASTSAPVLNVADFTCFLQKYANLDPYANCDGSTVAPTLNVADFTCFLQKYANGCP